MGKLPKKVLKADYSKIRRHELTPNSLEIGMSYTDAPIGYEIRAALVFEERYKFPLSLPGEKPMEFPRRVTTTICREMISPDSSKNEQVRLEEKMKRAYNGVVKLIQQGRYSIHIYDDGRLEFKLNKSRNK